MYTWVWKVPNMNIWRDDLLSCPFLPHLHIVQWYLDSALGGWECFFWPVAWESGCWRHGWRVVPVGDMEGCILLVGRKIEMIMSTKG